MNDTVSKQTLQRAQISEPNDDPIDLASYLDLLIDNRWLIILVTLVVTFISAAYAFITTPIYEANILVQVEDSANSSQNILGDLTGAFDLKSAATAEMEILRSRYVVSRAVDNARLDLVAKPKYFPVFGQWVSRRATGISSPGIFGYGGFVWSRENVQIETFQIPSYLEGENFVLKITGKDTYSIEQLEANISINGRVGETIRKVISNGTLEVRIESLVGNPGAEFIIKREPRLDTIEELQKSLAISEKGKQSGIIGVSLEGSDPEKTAATLNEIGKEYLRQNVERKSAEAEKSLEFLEKQLPEMKANLEKAESKYNALRNDRGTVDLNEEAKTILQQSVLSQTRLIELKQKKDELLTRYQNTNPMVEAVDRQIRTLHGEIESVNEKIRTMPSIEQDVLRLTRDVKVSTDLYTSLLNSAQQLRLLKASKVGNVRLLDKAVAPLHPVRPKRLIVMGLGVLIGLFFGVMCAFVRRSLFGRIDDPYEIEQTLGLTVTAAIPFSEKQRALYADVQARAQKVSVLATNDPSDLAIESLRSFRTSLQFTMLTAKNNIVMITGPTPAVGKSFVSVNFAAVMASSGKRVLLIDADLRKGYLNNYFGIDRLNGLSDIIAGKVSVNQTIHKDVVENVDFISTGQLPPNPAELLGHRTFSEALEQLSQAYDFVLIDTAPVLAVTDAMVVAPHVGVIFNVVRSGVSALGEIDESVKRLNQAGNVVAGIVFNGLQQRIGSYGYGGKYAKYRYSQYKY